MSALEYIRALFDYSAWANGHVLDAAAAVPEDKLAQPLGASFDSVQGNLVHVLGAQDLWLSRWTGAAQPPLPQLPPGSVIESLRAAYEASHTAVDAYLASLAENALDRSFPYTDTRGVAQQRLLWQALLHVVNHGTHHRAETALVLTQLGAPPRQLDYVFFEIERAGGAPRLT